MAAQPMLRSKVLDAFTVIILGGTGGLFVGLLLLGLFYPGNGAEQLNWRPTRSAEVEAQNEIDDLDQMLEAANRRRRARGKEELTEASLRQELAATSPTRDEQLADVEIAQMLERKNVRRRKKGLPDLSREQYEAQLREDGRL